MSLWLKSFIGYILAVNIVMQMLPNAKYEHYVRLFTGFLLILFLLQPVLKIGSADSFFENKINESIQEYESLEEEIEEKEKLFQQQYTEIEIQEIESVRVEVTGDD